MVPANASYKHDVLVDAASASTAVRASIAGRTNVSDYRGAMFMEIIPRLLVARIFRTKNVLYLSDVSTHGSK